MNRPSAVVLGSSPPRPPARLANPGGPAGRLPSPPAAATAAARAAASTGARLRPGVYACTSAKKASRRGARAGSPRPPSGGGTGMAVPAIAAAARGVYGGAPAAAASRMRTGMRPGGKAKGSGVGGAGGGKGGGGAGAPAPGGGASQRLARRRGGGGAAAATAMPPLLLAPPPPRAIVAMASCRAASQAAAPFPPAKKAKSGSFCVLGGGERSVSGCGWKMEKKMDVEGERGRALARAPNPPSPFLVHLVLVGHQPHQPGPRRRGGPGQGRDAVGEGRVGGWRREWGWREGEVAHPLSLLSQAGGCCGCGSSRDGCTHARTQARRARAQSGARVQP